MLNIADLFAIHVTFKKAMKFFDGVKIGYPKSRQQHDATIQKLESGINSPDRPSIKILIIRGVAIIVYLLLGAFVFRTLEHTNHDKNIWRKKVEEEKMMLAKEFNISIQRLNEFEDLVNYKIQEKRVSHRDWDYYQSLYFASTVTTTIGYGHITPQTQGGRVFLIVFALIGIPLNILALASVGEHITVLIFYFLRFCNQKIFGKCYVNHINIKVVIVSFILMMGMLFLGGLLYSSTEDWTYVDSIYYCFIAMSTIGFGDLVPNRGRAPDTKEEKAIWFLRALYLSIGLSLVSTVFTALSNAMEEINGIMDKSKYEESWQPSPNKLLPVNLQPVQRKYSKSAEEKRFARMSKKKIGTLRSREANDWDGLLAEHKRKAVWAPNSPQKNHIPRRHELDTESSRLSASETSVFDASSPVMRTCQRHAQHSYHKKLFPNQSSPLSLRRDLFLKQSQERTRSQNTLPTSPVYLEIPNNCGMWSSDDIMANQC